MMKAQQWDNLTYLRKTIKDRRTKIVKDKSGGQKGGVILTDETVKPYMEELAKLEAKMAEDKDKMSAGERVDTAAAEVMAAAEQNKDELKGFIGEQFAKAFPKKFQKPINQWAYIEAKGSGDYYKTPEGGYVKRLGDIPPGCIFIHKVRVQEQIDDELDMYKYFHEDGTVGALSARILST